MLNFGYPVSTCLSAYRNWVLSGYLIVFRLMWMKVLTLFWKTLRNGISCSSSSAGSSGLTWTWKSAKFYYVKSRVECKDKDLQRNFFKLYTESHPINLNKSMIKYVSRKSLPLGNVYHVTYSTLLGKLRSRIITESLLAWSSYQDASFLLIKFFLPRCPGNSSSPDRAFWKIGHFISWMGL